MASRRAPYRGIRQLGPARWQVRARATDPRTGRSVSRREVIECETIEEAAARRVAMVREIEAGGAGASGPASRPRLRDVAESWLERRRPRVRETTAARYEDSIPPITAGLGDMYIDALRPCDVEEWMLDARRDHGDEPGYAAATINGWLRVLRSILADAEANYGTRNVASMVRPLPESREPKPRLEPDELAAVLAYVREAEPESYALLLVLAVTGMRWGEATALRWSDVDEDQDQGVIRVMRRQYRNQLDAPKAGRARAYPLVPALRDALQAHRRRLVADQAVGVDSGYCFPVRARKPKPGKPAWALPAPSSWARALPRWLRSSGVQREGITPHALRRGACDLLRLAGVDEVVRRALVGHAGEAVHERYSEAKAAETAGAIGRVVEMVRGG